VNFSLSKFLVALPYAERLHISGLGLLRQLLFRICGDAGLLYAGANGIPFLPSSFELAGMIFFSPPPSSKSSVL